MLSLRFSLRELRGGLRGFRLFVACLGLGVAVIAGIGTLGASIVAGLERDGRSLLGGDIEFRLIHRPTTPQEQAFLESQGQVAQAVQMRAMAHAIRSDQRTLVELKAVDSAYPLYGHIDLEQPGNIHDLLAVKNGVAGVAVDPQTLIRLDAAIGDRLSIGEAEFEIRTVIAREPDRATEGLTLGPRVMIATSALGATKLVQPGTMAYWHYSVKLTSGLTAPQVQEIAKRDFAESGWRMRDWKEGSPGVRRFLDRAGLFLVLVGLTALLIGGVGVANAVHAHLSGKTPTIATLKSLGATSGLIFRVYLWQTLLLAVFGIGIGLVAGAALPNLAAGALAQVLPLPLVPGVYWQPLALAAAYGLLVALAFTIWPLARAAEIRPAALYRDLVAPGRRLPRPGYVIATLALFVALAALAILGTEERRFASAFVFAAIIAFVLFRVIAAGVAKVARHIRPRDVRLKLAFASLHRPGAATAALLLSLGVSLTLLVAITLVESNLHAQVEERLPDEAPAFFFVDIQNNQMDDFRATVLGSPGARDLETVPNLRGRITQVKGVPSAQIDVAAEQRWVLQGDRGLTYARDLPAGSKLTAGQWWPRDYNGPPLISIEEKAAQGLNVGIGDKLTVNVLGRDIEAEVASIRQLDWSSMGINFVLVFSPGLLERAPHTFLATVKASPAAELNLFRIVTQKFPGISVVRMKDVLTELNSIVLKLGAAVRGAAAITLVAGLIVLAGALAAEHRRRLKEGAILKALGATRRDIILAHVIEYGTVGLVGAALAFLLGWAAAWAMVTVMMNAQFYFAPGVAAATALGGVAATLLLGLAGAWQALAAKPAPLLRTV
ncbi:FtsX-like permease family protein [Ferrovibrio terrae]|uniref:FtsX-like permease family protein n=1 Tax=Ferrovibrio terrae TaxID=2594003 RepID=A0A516H252_9PROT|nr:FtsX-like permease family protein [Ferrovibrio terrae]QDO97660.1 FtsX-like permease family protein [Ferrovibrio terrae]